MQHKWHKEIKAWADGAEIEWRYFDTDSWMPNCNNNPVWHNDEYEFRIKPQTKEPQYLYVCMNDADKITFETGYDDFGIENDLVTYLGKIKLED
jgi:hypothetical protein